MPDTPGAAQGHRLEVLRAHHRADAGAARPPGAVIDDAAEEHLVFTGGPMEETRTSGSCKMVLDGLLGVPAATAPQMGGVAQLGLVVFEVEIDRLWGDPSKMIMSQPANFISAPKKPPDWSRQWRR